MSEFLRKIGQWILKFISFIFKSLFQSKIKELVKEVVTEIPATQEQAMVFENASYTIDIATSDTIRSDILNYLQFITKDCVITPELKKLFLLLSTVSTSVLTPIKYELLESFNDMFNSTTSELPDEDRSSESR